MQLSSPSLNYNTNTYPSIANASFANSTLPSTSNSNANSTSTASASYVGAEYQLHKRPTPFAGITSNSHHHLHSEQLSVEQCIEDQQSARLLSSAFSASDSSSSDSSSSSSSSSSSFTPLITSIHKRSTNSLPKNMMPGIDVCNIDTAETNTNYQNLTKVVTASKRIEQNDGRKNTRVRTSKITMYTYMHQYYSRSSSNKQSLQSKQNIHNTLIVNV